MPNSSFFSAFSWALLRPKSEVEDDARREYILNVLLVSVIGLLALFSGIVSIQWFFSYHTEGSASPFAVIFALFILITLFGVSRFVSFRLSATLFVFFGWIAVLYTNLSRGIDLPMSWMFYGLLVYISSILISSRFAWVFTMFASLGFFGATYLHVSGNNPFFVADWRIDGFHPSDAVGFTVSLGVVCVVSWLSSREIDRSLARARKSEAALKIERDSLEIKVEQRTRELKEEQRERLESVERFADFGRLASGILHDLANPLTSMSLNLQRAKDAEPESQKQLLERVTSGTERMESLLRTARMQFRSPADLKTISVAIEIEQAAEILSHVAREKRVRLDFHDLASLEIHGSPYSFNRILVNVIGNAIEACDGHKKERALVGVRAYRDLKDAVICVEDEGSGIPEAIRGRVFEPFFTTKMGKGGSGMGLATAKNLTEREFHGTLTFEDRVEGGTRFFIRVPLHEANV